MRKWLFLLAGATVCGSFGCATGSTGGGPTGSISGRDGEREELPSGDELDGDGSGNDNGLDSWEPGGDESNEEVWEPGTGQPIVAFGDGHAAGSLGAIHGFELQGHSDGFADQYGGYVTIEGLGAEWAAMVVLSHYGDLRALPLGETQVFHGSEPSVATPFFAALVGCSGEDPNYDFDEPADDLELTPVESETPGVVRYEFVGHFANEANLVSGFIEAAAL